MNKLIPFLMALLLMMPGVSHAQNQTESWLLREFRLFRVYPRLDRAERLYQQMRFTEAQTLLEQAVRIDPSYIQALRLLVETCTQLEDFQCVERFSRRLLALPEGNSAGAYYMMQEASRQGNYLETIRWAVLSLSAVNLGLTELEKTQVRTLLQEALRQSRSATSVMDANNIVMAEMLFTDDSDLNVRTLNLDDSQASTQLSGLKEATQSGKTTSMEDQLLLMNLFEINGDYQSALDIAHTLPATIELLRRQAVLLEKLMRYSEAAQVMESIDADSERKKPEYWRTLFNLYGDAGDTEQQISILAQAADLMKTDPEFLNLASQLLLQQVSVELSDSAFQPDSESYLQQRDSIAQLLALIENNRSTQRDDYLQYRVDAEITLASNYLYQGDENSALGLIELTLNESRINYDQANSLAQLIWGMGRCPDFINENNTSNITDNYGLTLIMISCQRRLGDMEAALELTTNLIAASDIPAADRNHLMRMQGYLLLDLEQVEEAIEVWERTVAEEFDPVLVLGVAYARGLLGQWHEVEALLDMINWEQMSGEVLGQYWLLRGDVAANNNDEQLAISYYREAVNWDSGNLDLWNKLINSAESSGDIAMGTLAWHRFLELDEFNATRQAEFAYYLRRVGKNEEAILHFNNALSILPENYHLYRDLGYTELSLLNYSTAAQHFRDVIDLTSTNITENAQLYQDQLQVDALERHWTFEASEVVRLNDKDTTQVNPLLRNSSYRGYGSMVLSYLPEFGRDQNASQRLILNSRLFWSNPNQSLNPEEEFSVLALGARYKLMEKQAVFISLEQLFGIGNAANDDVLLRLSASFTEGLAWPFADKFWNYSNLYLDSAYFLESDVKYGTLEFEQGRVLRLGDSLAGFGLMPFYRAGATFNNDNALDQNETRIDAGIGISVLGRYAYSKYRGFRGRSRFSILLSHKLGGNTQDKLGVHLRMNTTF